MIEKNMLVWVFVFEGVFDKKVVTEETGNQMRSGKLFCLLTESSSAVEKLQCRIQTHTYTQRHVNILMHRDTEHACRHGYLCVDLFKVFLIAWDEGFLCIFKCVCTCNCHKYSLSLILRSDEVRIPLLFCWLSTQGQRNRPIPCRAADSCLCCIPEPQVSP